VGGCNYRGISEYVRRAAAGRRKWDAVKARITRDALLPATTLRAAPERPPSRDIVDFYFLSLLSPRARHNTSSATQDELRVPITLLSTLTAFLPFHFPFILHLCSRILALSNNAYRYLATSTRHPYVLSFTLIHPSLYTLIHSI
jgi:hypothetical protein